MEVVYHIKKKSFLAYIHHFRGIAIVLIVASHILYIDTENSDFYNVLSALFLNSTLFFVFISGFLFQYLSYNYNIKKYWKRKFQTIILPYIVISIPAIILRLFTNYTPFTIDENLNFENWNFVIKILYFYATGAHLLPFWYIPMIILFYAISSVLLYLDRNTHFYWLLPIFILISLYFPRDDINEINNIFRMFAHYFSIYILGMFFSRYNESILPMISKYWVYIVGISMILFVISCFQFEYTVQVIFVQKVFFCVVLIHCLKVVENKMPPILGNLAIYSFGIYFIHYYIILLVREILFRIAGYKLPQNTFEWIIIFLFVIFSSYASVLIIKRLLGKNSRILLGC